jgi:2,4-dienoyl-CoA reductase-like NADH-dependent reductase (Old Yellow Enzyme family)
MAARTDRFEFLKTDEGTRMSTSLLFSPYSLRGIELDNRIVVSPMGQYSADHNGCATDWHLVHLGHLAMSGAGLLFTEATAVEPEGRISDSDLGVWSGHACGKSRSRVSSPTVGAKDP